MDLYAEILQASWSDAFRMTAAGEGGSSGAGRFGERFKRSETRRTFDGALRNSALGGDCAEQVIVKRRSPMRVLGQCAAGARRGESRRLK
jgi:hypothetical protein